jgi:hypothetical protein
MYISPSVVKTVASDELRLSSRLTKHGFNRKFRSFFGLGPRVTATVWNTLVLQDKLPPGGLVKHLLWCLAFLKLYATEAIYSSMFSVTEKTFRKWVWKFLNKIHTIEVVSIMQYFYIDNFDLF